MASGVALGGLPAVAGAWAQDAAGNLADLNYQDTAWARGELGKRGYRQQSNDGSGYENWWNASSRQCVIMHSEGRRVSSVVNTSSIDCGQQASGDDGKDSSNAAAAVVAAAALIGVAALAHKSQHHDDGRHGGSASDEADFERGYRDGLYNQSYDTHSGSQYSQGYSSGARDRASNTSYRGYSSSSSPQVTCESVGNQRVECDMDTRGSVRVVRQLSHSPCTEGVSWGLSKHSVWVENGCRAIFQKN